MFPSETIIKIVLGVLLSVLLSTGIYLGYSHIKNIGYLEAEAKYTTIIKTYEDSVNNKIDTVVSMSNELATANKANNEQLVTDVTTILSKVKGKQLVIIKNGECVPSQTFSDSFVQINQRVNQSIKESQK
jgi:hypothetical protein